MEYKDSRAQHAVYVIESQPSFGACVKFQYKGYEISLAMDGSNTCVFEDATSNTTLFEAYGTGVESIMEAKDFVDSLTSGE